MVALLTSAIMICGLAACGNTDSNDGKSGTESKFDWTAGADASDGDVTLRVATWRKYDKEYYEEIIRRFEEKYDWIDVELEINPDSSSYYTNLQADLISGVAPDVFDSHPSSVLVEFANEGMLAPQTDFDYMKNYKEEAKNVTTLGEENYGYMNAYNYFGFLYNKDIFTENGVAIPTTPEELVNVVNELKKAGYGGIAYSGSTEGYTKLSNMVSLLCLGTEGYDALEEGIDDGSITDISTVDGVPNALKTCQLYTQSEVWYNSFENIAYESALSLFAQKKAPILCAGSYLIGEAVHFEGIDVGFFPIPTYANNGKTYAEGAQTTVINAAGKNLGAAKLWVEHLASAEISEYYCTSAGMMSTIEGITVDSDILKMLDASCSGYALKSLTSPKNDEYWMGGYADVWEGVIFDGKDWEDLVKKYTNKLEDYDLANLSN